MKFILASASPRRRELLQSLGYAIEVFCPEISELGEGDPLCVASFNARNKAEAIFNSTGLKDADILIGADTIVVLDNCILGKPGSTDDAYRMLAYLSGRTHLVITALCLINREKKMREISVCTKVSFRNLSEQEIASYLQCQESLDKAGAYGIQGAGASLIKEINGSITNVIGLPVEELLNESKLLKCSA